MNIKDIDLNKDGVTLGNHLEHLKEGVTNLFDGDDTNSNNVIDRISHQMVGSVTEEKINSLVSEDISSDSAASEDK